MNHWRQIGPEWKTETVFRIREILKEEHIPFRMPFSDIFFVNVFQKPAEDKRWGILVREKDRERAAALLVREDIISCEMIPAVNHEDCGAGAGRTENSLSVLPSE